jgi:Amt family ammonium transporter
VLNTNLACAVAFLSWVGLDYATGHKPSLISSVNGMITGLVVITPAAGFVNGWGALCIGLIGGTICYFALNYLSRVRPFRNVDDTLGVIYTHGFAGLSGGLLLGFFCDPNIIVYAATGGGATDLPGIAGIFNGGNAELLKDELVTGLWVIGFSAAGTFILLKLVGLFVPLRMEEADLEEGDIAVHGHEVYPSDVPSLAYPSGAQAG